MAIEVPTTSLTINTTMSSDSGSLNYDIKCIIRASQESYGTGNGIWYIGSNLSNNRSWMSIDLYFYDHSTGSNIRYTSSTGSIILTIRERYICISIKQSKIY